MTTKTISLAGAALLCLLACNTQRNEDKTTAVQQLTKELKTTDGMTDSIPMPQQTGSVMPEAAVAGDKNAAPVSPKPVPVNWDKKIVKTGSMNVEVKDFNAYSTQVRAIAGRYGGYVAAEQQQQSEYKTENTITLKVPVALFDDMVNELSRIPAKIISREAGSEDVTTEMVDIRSRIEAKKQVREKYLEFLKQSKNMEEVLQVQQEINGIQEQIEIAAGRANYLGHSTTFSTLKLTFYQVLNAETAVIDEERKGFAAQAGTAMQYGLNIIKTLALGIITIWPLVLIAAVLWILYRRRSSRTAQQQTTGKPAEDQQQ